MKRTSKPLISRLLSFNVAHRFGLPPEKGGIRIGADADLAVVDLRQEFTVEKQDLFYPLIELMHDAAKVVICYKL